MLLVEDNSSDVFLIRRALEHAKVLHNLHVAADGKEALDFLRDTKDVSCPDLILLDLNMPGMNGFEFLEEMKKDERFKAIPVIVLTTSTAEKDILKSYMLHANCFITKPVGYKELVEAVKGIEDFWFRIAKLPPRAAE